MDNIEKLISGADPAKQENAGGPGPLQLQDPVPIFTQSPWPIKRASKANGWRIFAAGTAVVAVTAGIIVWSPWNAPPVTVPAAPTTTLPVDPSPDPSGSASIDDSYRPQTDYGLPNFLVPAHQNVYFEDSTAGNALVVSTLVVRTSAGILGTLPGGPAAHPVIGCRKGVATIMTSDMASDRSAAPGTLPEGIMVARWKDDARSIEVPATVGSEHEMFTWPQLRAQGNPESAARIMAGQLNDMGIKPEDSTKLMGPNVPSWMGKTASTDFIEYGNRLVSFTYPNWEFKESMSDENGNPIAEEKGTELTEAARYDLQAFDSRGKQVFGLISVKKGSIFEPTACSDPETTYRLDGESPSGVTADSGPLKLALITKTTAEGGEHSWVGLFPVSLPATGKACNVRIGVDRKDRTLMLTEWVGPMGFKDQSERDAYLKSPEYADAKKVASLLNFDHVG